MSLCFVVSLLVVATAVALASNKVNLAHCFEAHEQLGGWPSNARTRPFSADLDENQLGKSWPNEPPEADTLGLGQWEPVYDVMRRAEAASAAEEASDLSHFAGEDNEYQQEAGSNSGEIFLLEDKDYPKSIFEDYSRKVGQVSGITTLPSDDVVIFHRAERQWTRDSEFPSLNPDSKLKVSEQLERIQDQLIKNDTLMIIDGENGNEVSTLGKGLFFMPHSVASDPRGNLWVSDVGRHQVMRLPTATMNLGSHKSRPPLPGNLTRIWPDIVLGEAFSPGQGRGRFCQPAEIAVSSSGRLVFVADGYCNSRVVVYTGEGQYLTSFGQEQRMKVVHSLALFEQRNLLCVADRENGRILCFAAGLDGDLSRLGQLVHQLHYPIGRVFALASISPDHLLVSSNQNGTNRYDLAILNPFTHELKLVWTSSDLLEPHSLARTLDQQYAYAADVSRDAFKKVFKFNIISRKT